MKPSLCTETFSSVTFKWLYRICFQNKHINNFPLGKVKNKISLAV